MRTLLIINDDGIHSIGLISLRKQFEKLGTIIIVAPKDERSGNGEAITDDQTKIIDTQHRDGSEARACTKNLSKSLLNNIRILLVFGKQQVLSVTTFP